MQVAVKTPHINITGAIPPDFIETIKKRFGASKVKVNDDDELVSAEEAEAIMAELRKKITQGDKIAGLRMRLFLSQKKLAEQTGISVKVIADLEHNRRPLDIKTAKILAKAFKRPVKDFFDK